MNGKTLFIILVHSTVNPPKRILRVWIDPAWLSFSPFQPHCNIGRWG